MIQSIRIWILSTELKCWEKWVCHSLKVTSTNQNSGNSINETKCEIMLFVITVIGAISDTKVHMWRWTQRHLQLNFEL